MTTIAIIPARGGSKRLPRKNIIPVLGKPSLFYPIQAAVKTGLFNQVIVSTEDDEIKQVAEESGAFVMERPKELARDESTVAQTCWHVIERLHDQGINPEKFCCIYATALFITPGDLQGAFHLMENCSDTDVVMGISKFNLHPLQAMETKGNGFLKPKWPEYNNIQSQHHPALQASNGTLYWADTSVFLRDKTFYVKRLRGYEIPWIRAIDLDTPDDYENARLLAPLFLNRI